MSLWEAIILGIVQGLTEFLPVSSSGHLELGKAILGTNKVPQESMLFTVAVHGATALSTMVVYWKDIQSIIFGIFKKDDEESKQFALKIILSMIPAAFVGVVFDEQIELLFGGNIAFVGAMLLVTGVLLIFADKAKDTESGISFVHSIVIGISQAIAILPGISRSGATISTSVLLGNDRSRAARFSFLMVVPLIMGKMAKDLLDGEFNISDESMTAVIAGFIAAFVFGLIACKWMIKLVRNAKLTYFAIYCFLVGTTAIIFSFL
ncbi:MAG: undecaprenyl-diphosphate phosphatase [Bacteroidia bacterium]|nr:undecaprenyl-diphosphate phosphatase [Bacteroidia bacterium]